MLERLFGLPRRKELESLRSLYLRIVALNGLTGITQLAVRLGHSKNVDSSSLLAGTGSVYEALRQEAPELVDSWRTHHQFELALANLQIGYFGSDCRKICPDCLAAGWFDLTFDLPGVEACHRHSQELQTHCASCSKPIRWTSGHQRRCGCGAELTSMGTMLVSDVSGVKALYDACQHRDIGHVRLLLSISRLVNAPARRYCANDALNLAAAIIRDPESGLSSWLTQRQSDTSCLPHRLLLAPWLALHHQPIRQSAIRLLRRAPKQLQPCNGSCSKLLSIPIPTLESATGLKRGHLIKLITAGMLERDDTGCQITAASLCQLYQSITNAKRSTETGRYHYLLGQTKQLPVTTTLARLKAGTVALKGFSIRLSFKHLHYIDSINGGSPGYAETGLMTLKSAAATLQVSTLMLHRLLRLPSINSPEITVNKQRMVDAAVIRMLDEHYVSLDALRRVLGRKAREISWELAQANILPVHDPVLDGSVLTVYSRPKVDAHLAAQRGNRKSSSRVARPLQLPEDAIDYLTTTQRLKRPGTALPGLIAARLLRLHRCSPEPTTELTTNSVFDADSVKRCEKWLNESLPIDRAAQHFGMTIWNLRKKLFRSGLLSPICLGRSDQLAKKLFRPLAQNRPRPPHLHIRAAKPPRSASNSKKRTRPTIYHVRSPASIRRDGRRGEKSGTPIPFK